jgi:hypothetical protein
MHDSTPEPTGIDPLVIECDFFDSTVSSMLNTVIGRKTSAGTIIRAIVLDSYITHSAVTPRLGMMAMVEDGEGNIFFPSIKDCKGVLGLSELALEVLDKSCDIESSLEYLTDKLPLKKPGKYLRTFHTGSFTVISMEYLEGWLWGLGDHLFVYPEAIDNRAQVCTLALPHQETAHQKIEAISSAQKEWDAFKVAWPAILGGGEYAKRITINDPDLSVYPTAP